MPGAQIESLLEQDLDQLLESFGTELEKQHLGARPKSREARINNARRWIEQKRTDICRSLSKEPTLVAYICEEKMFGRVEAITAIIDALSGDADRDGPDDSIGHCLQTGVSESSVRLSVKKHASS